MEVAEIGKTVKHRREALDLTIRDLAEVTGLSKTTITQIETGSSNPTFEVLQKIFEYLNLEMKIEVRKQI
ncbi:transcriptional regulator [Sphingobacteriaceae bacterium]|nr:transcriptional regulator [Sphingobacteriaceae bacterium]